MFQHQVRQTFTQRTLIHSPTIVCCRRLLQLSTGNKLNADERSERPDLMMSSQVG